MSATEAGTGTGTAAGTGTGTAAGTGAAARVDWRTRDPDWWKTAVVYQVYIRSFADSDGDGLGDLEGLRRRLPHLSALGVDAFWINPWYPSPMADAGYDVADYRDIEPAFGTLADSERFLAETHAAGIRVLLDIVPNHTSSEHAWFVAALAGDAAARARYVFRPGRGPGGDEAPNNWQSSFGGPAWTRTKNADGTPGDFYLHLFAPGQPDLDWSNPEVVAEFEDVLRFWFDRGVDGFRIDVAHGLVKAEGLPDAPDPTPGSNHVAPHPAWDQEGVHEVYKGWRRIADSYDPPRVFVGEIWVADSERLARYLGADELQTAFQFDFLRAAFRADVQRRVVDEATRTAAVVGAPSTWVLSNHDVVRHVTRYARSQPDGLIESAWDRQRWSTEPADLELGRARGRAAVLLTLALPGTAYVYQGEELGLDEVEDIPSDLRQDPTWWQSGYADPGRDGCRVPLPWSGDTAPFGFSPDGASRAPWLPQPAAWSALTAQAQEGVPGSTLTLYQEALRLRREHLTDLGALEWLDSPGGVLSFRRGSFSCHVNTGTEPVPLPAGRVLLVSGPLASPGVLPPETTAWVLAGGPPV